MAHHQEYDWWLYEESEVCRKDKIREVCYYDIDSVSGSRLRFSHEVFFERIVAFLLIPVLATDSS